MSYKQTLLKSRYKNFKCNLLFINIFFQITYIKRKKIWIASVSSKFYD